jgi:putative ABC transport system substrate-binding protein
MAIQFRRREFIFTLGGAAAAWPLAGRAQQGERVRRIGVLTPLVEADPETQMRIAAFRQGLEKLGWVDGRNIRIDYRWGGGNAERICHYAADLIALGPDVVLAHGSPVVAAFQQATRTVPIVFANVIDPVSAGFIDSLPRPGRNITGFTLFEYAISGKWLELLKEIAPRVKRVAVLRDTSIAAGAGQLGAMQTAAAGLGMELSPSDVRDAAGIERALTTFASAASGGLVVTGSTLALNYRSLIVTLAIRHKLPAVYPYRYFAAIGGLISYGPNPIGPYRRASEYVARILRGEKAGDLPVQNPTSYDLVINLKTAKALGLEVPPMLLARADEVIE